MNLKWGRAKTAVAVALLAAGLLAGGVACSSDDSAGSPAPAASTASPPPASTAATPTSAAPSPTAQTPPTATQSPTSPTDTALATAATSSSAAEPAATPTTSGPAPEPGNITEEVPEIPVTTRAPVPFQSRTEFGGAVSIRVADVAAITATAQLPGEVAGPAVAVTIEIDNGSAAAIGLDNVTADLLDGDGNPALPTTTAPARPFSGVLVPGEAATAVYVFTAPVESRDDMALTVTYSTGAPTVLFVGALPIA